MEKALKTTREKATFGAGCFWGVEELFRNTKGVVKTKVGYMGGVSKNPGYEEVCTGTTGHAEVVHLEFDPKTVTYAELLKIFWDNHNPTTVNRQGPDVGTQYRSVVFFHTNEQERLATALKNQLNSQDKFKGKIVTEIVLAKAFYPAEEYHQRYLEKKGLRTCHI